MKVFLMTDIEGITNVDTFEMIQDDNPEGLKIAVENLMADVNAAIAGFYDGGAEKVYVFDGHGGGQNFDKPLLDPRAEQVYASNWEKIITSGEVQAYAEVGLHAMSGAYNAFLDHTQSSKKWFDYKINGRSCGELIQGAGFVGAFGIPMVMVTGDIAVCEEAKMFLGDIATAAVKRAVGRNRAVSLPTEEARKLIYEAAKKSLSLVGKIRPYKVILPAEIKLTFQRSDYCDATANWPVERLDARTVRKVTNEITSYRSLMPY